MKTWMIACLALVTALPVAVTGNETKALQQTATNAPADPALRKELLAMFEADQAAQQRMIHGDGDAAGAEMAALNARHLEQLKAIIDKHGWPTHELVGEDGAHAAWLLVQHMDADPDFQERCLALLESAVARGQASAKDLAYLADRVRVARGKLQVYGTQFRQEDGYTVLAPVENPESLDERRRSVGLPSMDEYYEMMKGTYPDIKMKPFQP